RWGKDDQLGTLNLITPEKRVQAAALVKSGISVSLARNVEKQTASDNPMPFLHGMLSTGKETATNGPPILTVSRITGLHTPIWTRCAIWFTTENSITDLA